MPNEIIRQMVKESFKDEKGNPIVLTDGQLEIFELISTKSKKRLCLLPHTRYGKSMTVSLAVLTRASVFPEKWAIIGGTEKKAKIIMEYINSHIFDNALSRQRFIHKEGDEDTIRKHRNKNRITFDLGNGKYSEIFICTAKDALGFGAPNIVEDEAPLIEDNEQDLVERMLGDDPDNNFLCKIGNPLRRNHFLRSFNNPMYHSLVIDWKKGMSEGRITQEFIDEMRNNMSPQNFSIFYDCQFPTAEMMDTEGYMYLLTESDITMAQQRKVEPYGAWRLGVDVARGGRNFNVWVLRCENYAKILKKDHDPSLMGTTGTTIGLMREYNVKPDDVFVDDVGVGGGVVDRLKEQGYNIVAVKEGERAREHKEFTNLRAEMYCGSNGLANFIRRGAQIETSPEWMELVEIRYKKDSTGRTKLESKDDMRSRGVESPDVADALALTFATTKEKFYPVTEDRIKNALMARQTQSSYIGYDQSLGV